MDLRQLRYFQAVAEELSYSRASQKLRVAQPALSRAIMELEQELGAELLRRTRRSVNLTPAGAVLLHEAGLLLSFSEETIRKVKRTASGQEGELRLGFIGPPTRPFLAPLLREFTRLHPKVTVALEERTPERVWEMVSKGRIDIGLTRPVAAGDRIGLETFPLRQENICAVLPRTHPLAKKDSLKWSMLAGQPLILLARREGVGLHDTILQGCQDAGFSPHIAHAPSVVGTVPTYVEAGVGIGVVPESVDVLNQSEEIIFRTLHPVRQVELVMVWHPEQSNPAAAAFRQLAIEWLKQQ